MLNMITPVGVQGIINKFCYTIGMIPTSYKISLTYEEQIIAIGEYLEKTVYPAINKNAEALAELQELFQDLKDYVDNYFDNIDVQDEINNKLDAMAESGQLQEIIASYINMNAVLTVDTVSDMILNSNLIDGSYVHTLGYYQIGDGGAADYLILDDDTLNTDGAFTILLNSGLRAVLQFTDEVSILQIGGRRQRGGARTDIHDIIEKYIEKNEDNDEPFALILPAGIYYTSPLNIVSNNYIIRGEYERNGVLNGSSAKATILSAYEDQTYIIKCGDEATGSGYGTIENIIFSTCVFNDDFSRNSYHSVTSACLVFEHVYFMKSKFLAFEYIKGTAFKINTSWELMINFLDFYHVDGHEKGVFVFDEVLESVTNGNISDSNFAYLHFEQILGHAISFKEDNKAVSLHFGTINLEPSAITDMGYTVNDYSDQVSFEEIFSVIELKGGASFIVDNMQLNNFFHRYHVINSLNYIFGDIVHLNGENLTYKVVLNTVALQSSNTNVNLIKSIGNSYDNWYSRIIVNNITNNAAYNMLINVKETAKIILKDCISGIENNSYYIKDSGQMIPCYKNIYNSYLSLRGLIAYDPDSVNPEHLVVKNNGLLTSVGKRLFAFIYNSTTLKFRAKIENEATVDFRVFGYNPANNTYIAISEAVTLTGTGEYEQYSITLSNITKMYGTIAYLQIVDDNVTTQISLDSFSN